VQPDSRNSELYSWMDFRHMERRSISFANYKDSCRMALSHSVMQRINFVAAHDMEEKD
jgi:hypothetical protein